MPVFRIDKWRLEVSVAPFTYAQLRDLAEDEKAVAAHIANDPSQGDHREPKLNDQLERLIRDNLRTAVANLSDLMVVLASTLLEDILTEFFDTLFATRPDLERQCRALRPPRAGVSESATSLAKRGGPRRYLALVRRLTGYRIETETAEGVRELVALRNQIVHEGALARLEREAVQECFHIVHRLIRELGFAAKAAGVAIQDRAGLLLP